MNTVNGVPRPRLERFRFIRDMLSTLAFGVAVFTLLQLSVPQSVVRGRSMEPSLYDGQRLFISRVSYMVARPARGDIIVFNSPHPRTDDEPPLIKRVIGLPGEFVEMRDQRIYINGQLLDEPYINEACSRAHCPDQSWPLGEDDYFVLGDNRNHSNDSRSFGPVRHELIIGEAVLRIWPLEDFAYIQHYRYD